MTTTREELAKLIDTAWEYPREHLVDHHMDAAAAILSRYDLHPKGSVVVPAEVGDLPPYRPAVIEYPDSGRAEFVMEDVATVTHYGDRYDTLTDMVTGKVIGFSWPLAARPGASHD